MQRQPATAGSPRQYRFRHYRKSTAHTSEAAVFRETPQLDRALTCAGNFKNRMRNFRIGNVRLIRGIEDQKRIVFLRVIDPARELSARSDSASWIVWKTKIDEVDMLLRWLGNKIVFRRAGQIINALVAPIISCRPRVARHHVCVHVHWIHWIRDRDFILTTENIEDVTAIVF